MTTQRFRPIFALLSTVLSACGTAAAAEKGAPIFGPNVLVFDPSMPDIQPKIDAIFAQQEHAEFGEGRYLLLFKPGHYQLDVKTGFYTQVCGLGTSPDDVTITGAVRSKAVLPNGNATCNFWRCMENLCIEPTSAERKTNTWAVSQGTAIRRVHVKGNLSLWDHGWSSGGFLADSRIDGTVDSGSQQQWLSRNSTWRNWTGGGWNMVFVGDPDAPSGTWPAKPYTTVEAAPLTQEKPYLYINGQGEYAVVVPGLARNSRGTTWTEGPSDQLFVSLPIEQFFIAHAEDTAKQINAALSAGKNLLLTPGIYHLDAPLHLTRPNTVVLGLGYPTLIAERGTAAIDIADVDGVKVADVLLQAGAQNSPTLLQVGPSGSKADHAANPTTLYDIFARAGGAALGKTDSFAIINSSNVIGDNWWLWRADHGKAHGWTQSTVTNGLVVNGKDVTFYGLFVEHCQGYQTLWNGNGGRDYFYQSEMPYDPPSQAAWSHDGVRGYASYKVADNVTTHQAWGLGVYCVFVDAPVVADNAIETPTFPGVQMHHMITLRFAGIKGSGIEHVVNGRGGSSIAKMEARVE